MALGNPDRIRNTALVLAAPALAAALREYVKRCAFCQGTGRLTYLDSGHEPCSDCEQALAALALLDGAK